MENQVNVQVVADNSEAMIKANVAEMVKAIESLATSERNVKAKLAMLSRTTLQHIVVDGHNDIDLINRTINACSPVNKRAVAMFFSTFVPFKYDEKGMQFGEKLRGEKKITKFVSAAVEFLKDEDNTVWSWAAKELDIKKKPKDFAKLIERNVKQALAAHEDGEDNGLDPIAIIRAVMNGGLSTDEVLRIMAAMADVDDKAA